MFILRLIVALASIIDPLPVLADWWGLKLDAAPHVATRVSPPLVFVVFLWQDGVMYDSDLIRTGDAAQILGSSRQHVVDLCNQGLLSCERSPKQRRLRRSDVEAFASRIGSDARLNRDQRQSVWLHGAVAGHLANDPQGTLARARTNLGRLRETHPSGMSSRWLDAWQAVLGGGPEAVLQTLTSQAPLAIELRQNSPFAGVLSDDERRAVLGAFREQDHRAPA